MNPIEKSIIIQMRILAKKISRDKELFMSTVMRMIDRAIAEARVQKAIEKEVNAKLK